MVTVCDICEKKFVPFEKNEIWSMQTHDEPSSIMYYLCNKCLAKRINEENEYHKREQEYYRTEGDIHDDEDQHNTFKDGFHKW